MHFFCTKKNSTGCRNYFFTVSFAETALDIGFAPARIKSQLLHFFQTMLTERILYKSLKTWYTECI